METKFKVRILKTIAATKAPEVPISAAQLDKRSKPAFSESAHMEYRFLCQKIWGAMIEGKFKIVKTTISPAKWEREAFRMKDPSEFDKKQLKGIEKPKVKKYAEFMKQQGDKLNVPPVIFAYSKRTKKRYFIDGNHRLMAAFLAGIEELPMYLLDMDQLKRAYYMTKTGIKKRLVEKRV